MAIIIPANSAVSGAFSVANSCRFNAGDDPKLSRTSPNSSPTDIDKFTFSCWVKRGTLGAAMQIISTYDGSGGAYEEFQIYFTAEDALRIQTYNSGNIMELVTNRLFRDSSAWYSIIFSYDSSPSTPSASSIRLWINGVIETSFSAAVYPSQNADGEFAIQNHIQIIGNNNANNRDCGLYLAEVIGVDGQALVNTDFGEFNSDSPTIWQPIDVSGINVGVLGFYCDFEDSGTLGNDVSGVGDFTVANLAATDQATDTPTNNFCTVTPLDNYFPGHAFSEGNCRVTTATPETLSYSTVLLTTGKWYWEAKPISTNGTNSWDIGIGGSRLTATSNGGNYTYNFVYYAYNGDIRNASTGATDNGTDYGDTYAANDIIGVALDLDNNKLYVAKNGTWQNSGDPAGNSNGHSITAVGSTDFGGYYPAFGSYGNITVTDINFGNPPYANSSDAADANGYGAFEYAPPSGFLAVCTKNLGSDGG